MTTATQTLDPENPSVCYQVRPPGPPLRRFVRLIWYWRGYAAPAGVERLLPAATVELVINLASPDPANSTVAGPHSEAFFIERTSRDEMLGVHFAPGGAFPFLRFPYGDLHNTNVSLVDFCGESEGSRLLERLHRASGIESRFRVIEEWIVQIAQRPFEHHPGVALAMRAFERDPGLASSARVAEKINLSQGRFIRLFRDEVGLTPKLYNRLGRFNRIIQQIGRHDEVDWTDLALSAGYFDQSHFNHDFRAFSGLTPTQYMDLRIREHLGHVQVPD